jgi:hypothetical protein
MGIVRNEILSVGDYLKNKQLEIPHFQRPYKWTVKNAVQLVEDVFRFTSEVPYRIGTIVIYQENGKERIVDGQQRTITFILILKAILNLKYECLNEDLKNQLSEIKEHLFEPVFKSDISKNNIQKNYRAIERRIDTMDETFVHFFLNRCQITCFVIDDVSEAFQFFDSQNSRGRDLDPHDLLKAFHLREMQNKNNPVSETEITRLVESWEDIESKDLAKLFSEFLYRVRGWSKGNSSRYFTKKDTDLFKGRNIVSSEVQFPFQLDQTIINGKHFFEMICHYKKLYNELLENIHGLPSFAKEIIGTINSYPGRNRTGDKYVRMLFDCALLYYIDKFGQGEHLSKATEKIFIWAYRIRLTYQSLQLASVDNYVVQELNIFKIIKECTYSKEFEMLELPVVDNDFKSEKTKAIKDLFVKMKYYVSK